MPKRIQRQRMKGWRMPEGAVYVGRPSKWGNPYRVGAQFFDRLGEEDHTITREKAVELFRRNCDWRASTAPDAPRAAYIEHLRGKDLACWCPLEDENGNRVPCHADVLLEWANQPEPAPQPLHFAPEEPMPRPPGRKHG